MKLLNDGGCSRGGMKLLNDGGDGEGDKSLVLLAHLTFSVFQYLCPVVVLSQQDRL